MMIPPIYKTLKEFADVFALVADRIYFVEAPESIKAGVSYIVWSTPEISPENSLSERPDLDLVTVTVSCYHTEQLKMVELVEGVRDALEGVSYMVHADLSDRDKKTKMYIGYAVFDYYLDRGTVTPPPRPGNLFIPFNSSFMTDANGYRFLVKDYDNAFTPKGADSLIDANGLIFLTNN